MLERFIFRRGMWHEADLRVPEGARNVNGLQFWNGHRGSDFEDGRSFWIRQLLTGKRSSPIGANDAHGDLNRNIGVKTPLFSLYQNRNHVFGNVRTVVRSAEKTIRGIQSALAAGRLFCTDGPYLHLRYEDQVTVEARSTVDFGGFTKIILSSGSLGGSGEKSVGRWKWDGDGPLEFSEAVNIPPQASYLRAEAWTRNGRFALSAPVYLA
jgi:hypothetical protein